MRAYYPNNLEMIVVIGSLWGLGEGTMSILRIVILFLKTKGKMLFIPGNMGAGTSPISGRPL